MLTVGPLLNWAGTKMKEKKLKVARERMAHAIDTRDRDLKELEMDKDRRDKIADGELERYAVDQYIKTYKLVERIKKDAGAPIEKRTEKDIIESAIEWKNQKMRLWTLRHLTADDYINKRPMSPRA